MNTKIKWNKMYPFLTSFILMGFIDIMGVLKGFNNEIFVLPDNLDQFITSMALICFLLLSIPIEILQNKIGKRNMLNIGMGLSGFAILLPIIDYSYSIILVAFIFLGIGNTIIQVSVNPLLRYISSRENFLTHMCLTQYTKVIVSLLAPLIAAFMVSKNHNWRFVFAVYAITSLIVFLWLYYSKIKKNGIIKTTLSFKSFFLLLKNPFILMMSIGLFLTVGADVGINSNIQNYLMSALGLNFEKATLGICLYFYALMISRFLGVILLNWIKPRSFFIISSLISLLSVILMSFTTNPTIGLIAIILIGLGSGNLFPLIFSITANRMPEKLNEISGLMIMAVSGGAFIPHIMNLISESYDSILSLVVIIFCMFYLFTISIIEEL